MRLIDEVLLVMQHARLEYKWAINPAHKTYWLYVFHSARRRLHIERKYSK